MVKDAIKETPQEWADEALSETWGVKLGSLPDEVSASPSAKLINGIAAAEQHPESLQWVQEEQDGDYMTYILCGLIILVWIAGYFFIMWQSSGQNPTAINPSTFQEETNRSISSNSSDR